MMFEAVEPRRMFSGNVSVRIDSDTFRLTGDGLDNAVAVVRSRATGEFVLTGLNGTTIDGRATRTYTGRSKFFAAFGNGNDTLILDRFASGANLSINLGGGDDAIYVKRGLLAAADLYGDAGNDTLDITNSTFSKRLRVFAGEQDDVTAFRAVRARRGFEVTDTAGNSVVAMKQVIASDTSWFSGSGRRDDLRIADSDFVAFSAKLRDGNDRAYVRGTTFAQSSPIDGGAGTNDIDREVLLIWTFDTDTQGWLPQSWGPAAIPEGLELTPEQLLQQTGIEFGIRPSPEPTIVAGDALMLSRNGTLMFTMRDLGTDTGLMPSTSYDLSFGSSLMVSGDALNSRLFAGAVPVYPFITTSALTGDGSGVDLTIDGAQYRIAESGTNHADNVRGPNDYGPVERSAEPQTFTTDENGRTWLLFGSFEGDAFGRSPLYFRKIAVRFTPTKAP